MVILSLSVSVFFQPTFLLREGFLISKPSFLKLIPLFKYHGYSVFNFFPQYKLNFSHEMSNNIHQYIFTITNVSSFLPALPLPAIGSYNFIFFSFLLLLPTPPFRHYCYLGVSCLSLYLQTPFYIVQSQVFLKWWCCASVNFQIRPLLHLSLVQLFIF